MLIQLVYISKPVGEVSNAVSSFIPLAQVKNAEFDVTGMIISADNFYLQLIEGERENINQLYANLIKDPRHNTIVMLRYTEIKVKEFEQWSMSHMTLKELKKVALNGVTLPDVISPKTLSSTHAMAIIRRTAALLKMTQVDIDNRIQ